MNIWESVQRGLEKATHEAGRIARTQRLRVTIDALSKQIETQQTAIVTTAMELFKNGQLTQHELLLLCQELTNFQQQFIQAQNELKSIQNANSPQTIEPTMTVAYPQPPYAPYENTQPALVPPPPPGVEPLTVSSLETMLTPQTQCSICQAPLIPGNAFCHHCGSPVHLDAAPHQPTVRSNKEGEKTVLDVAEQATIRAEDAEQIIPDTPHDGGN